MYLLINLLMSVVIIFQGRHRSLGSLNQGKISLQTWGVISVSALKTDLQNLPQLSHLPWYAHTKLTIVTFWVYLSWVAYCISQHHLFYYCFATTDLPALCSSFICCFRVHQSSFNVQFFWLPQICWWSSWVTKRGAVFPLRINVLMVHARTS